MAQQYQSIRSAGRTRLVYLAIALGMIPVGLLARMLRDEPDLEPATAFVMQYLGDTLWAVMFFFLFAAYLVRWRTAALAGITLGFTLAIELSQFYQDEPLKSLRSFPPTGFLLGSTFLWSDVVCLLVGSVCAVLLHAMLRRSKAEVLSKKTPPAEGGV